MPYGLLLGETGKSMKILLIIFSGALIIGVIIYSWFNRDSDRVILTLVTAMTIGALGFITKESISNKTEKSSTEFPVVAFYGAPDYRPLNIKLPYGHELRMCLQELKNEDIPKDTSYVVIEFGQDKYFDALEYLIIKEIFKRFNQSWNVVAKQTYVPSGKSLSWKSLENPGEEVLLADILKNFSDNYFVKLGLHKNTPEYFGGKAIFPPDTDIAVKHEDKFHKTTIAFTNNYIKLNITFSDSTSSVGIGEYTKLLGGSGGPLNMGSPQPYGNAAYSLQIDVEQNLWLNGHPDMKTHRNWANSIIELLESTFNYEQIREEHLRQFQLFGPEGVVDL